MANKYRSALMSTARLNASVRPFGERDGQLSRLPEKAGTSACAFLQCRSPAETTRQAPWVSFGH